MPVGAQRFESPNPAAGMSNPVFEYVLSRRRY